MQAVPPVLQKERLTGNHGYAREAGG